MDLRVGAKCENCKYVRFLDARDGLPDRWICRRYPPSCYDQELQKSFAPDVYACGWCGEYIYDCGISTDKLRAINV